LPYWYKRTHTDKRPCLGDDFLVMASDGVWGWMTNQDVVEKVGATVKHVDFGPKRIVSEAYEAGSDDNITAIVVYLRPNK
jgi:serine/threonine protein phosphatase PrpC